MPQVRADSEKATGSAAGLVHRLAGRYEEISDGKRCEANLRPASGTEGAVHCAADGCFRLLHQG